MTACNVKIFKTVARLTTAIAAVAMLSGCGMAERLSAIGHPPVMSGIQNPYSQPGYRPVNLPMPPEEMINKGPNSLWEPSRLTFFKDQRAHKVGDILTITIAINDTANLQNKTQRDQEGTETQGLPNFFGYAEGQLVKKVLPGATASKLVGMNSASTSVGNGQIQRNEAINLKLAAMVTQVLPNGNLVIQGRQQVRVNFELRDLQLQGVIRPEDIQNNNTISYDKIAEARIIYGGKGNVSDIQQPRYGQQFYDAVMPF